MDLILAVETGGTKLQLALGLSDGTILHRYRTVVMREKGGRGILDVVEGALPHMRQKAAELGGRICRIGWGFGGPVITAERRAIGSALVPGWSGFNLGEYAEARTGLPTYVFNDANAATWGEYCCGAGRNTNIFFYTNIGSGVGGGTVLYGKLYDGQGYGATEFGQTWVGNPWGDDNYHSEKVENLCSGVAIEERMHRMDIPGDSMLWRLCSGDQQRLDCRMLGEAVKAGDPFATQLFDDIAHVLSIGLSNIISCFSPEKLAIGGGVSLIGEPLISRLREYTKDYVFFNSTDRFEIVQNELGEDVVLVGALLLAGQM